MSCVSPVCSPPKSAVYASDAKTLNEQAKGQALGANISYGVAGAAVVAAVISYFVLN